MSDEQIQEHFKEAFPPKTEVQLLHIDYTDVGIKEVRVLILLFKSKLPQSTSSSMLVHMTDRNEDTKCKRNIS